MGKRGGAGVKACLTYHAYGTFPRLSSLGKYILSFPFDIGHTVGRSVTRLNPLPGRTLPCAAGKECKPCMSAGTVGPTGMPLHP